MRNKLVSKKNAFKNTDNFLLSTLFLHCPDILIMIRDNIIIEFNPSAEQYFGHSRHEAINKSYALLCLESGKTAINFEHETCIESQAVKWSIFKESVDNGIEYIVIGKEEDQAQSFSLEDIKIKKIKNLMVDLTLEKEKIENDNKILSQYLQDIVSAVPGSIYWKNKEGIYLGCNDFMVKTAGLNSTADIIGKSDAQLWPNQATKLRENDIHVMKSGQPARIEEEVILPNGKKRFFIVDKMPLRDPDGHLNGIIGNSMEITDLKETQAALESANHAKTEFIANMSHDIRTPLTGITGLSKMIEKNATDPSQKNYAHLLTESGDELLKLFNSILELMSADNIDDNDMHEAPFDLRRMLVAIEHLERPTTTDKGINFLATFDERIPPCFIGDHTKIHRILLNLLGNAIKFTAKGNVEVNMSLVNDEDTHAWVQFRVSDTGIGIPPEMQDKVFDRFFRVSPSYKGIYTGHGVGLHIAQSYAHLLGSEILLSSQLGVGTMFFFALRLKKGDPILLPPVHVDVETTAIASSTPMPSEPVHSPKPIQSDKVTLPDNVPHLLLVEDNAIALTILENIVTEGGCGFMPAIDGLEALTLATTNQFDLIITDLGLPGLSGIEFTEKLRIYEGEQDKPPTPIIGLTAHADAATKQQCIDAGMNAAFTKPLTSVQLEEIKSTYLASFRSNPSPLANSISQCNNKPLEMPAHDAQAGLFQLDVFPVFDVSLFDAFLPREIVDKMLSMIIDESGMPNDLSELQVAYASGDWEAVYNVVRRMRSSTFSTGMERLSYACLYLLDGCHENPRNIPVLERLYNQILLVMDESILAVKKYVAR